MIKWIIVRIVIRRGCVSLMIGFRRLRRRFIEHGFRGMCGVIVKGQIKHLLPTHHVKHAYRILGASDKHNILISNRNFGRECLGCERVQFKTIAIINC